MRSGLFFLAGLFISFSIQAQTSSINWIKRNGPVGGDVRDIEIDPVSSKVFMIGGSRKPYVSNDNGETWKRITFQGSENNSFYDIEITNGTIFLLAGYALYASTDGGVNFEERMTAASPYQDGYRIKRMPTSGNLVVLAGAALYTSANNGVTWTQQGGTLTGVDTRYYLEINAVDQIFILKNNDLFTRRPFRSTDGGVTFTEASAGITVGQQVLNLSADNLGGKVYCLTGAGMFSSTNGVSWASIKTGSVTDAIICDYGMATSYIEFSADNLGMFFVDNVNHRLHSKTLSATTWVHQSDAFPSGTISATCATAKDYPGPTTTTAFFGTPSGIYRTTTGGASVTEKNVGFANVDIEQILIDDTDYLYAKSYSSGILKSQDGGNTWSRISALSGTIDHFFASPAGDALYALSGNVLYQSLNNGTTWPALVNVPTGGLAWAGATDNNKIFGLQYTCCSPNSFYYSSNKGVSWTAVTITGLPTPSVSFYENAFYFASQNRLLIYVYDYGLNAYAYYRIDFAYNPTTQAITSAVAAKITTEVGTNDIRTFQAANGKFYVYSRAASTYEVDVSSDGGLSWTVNSVPESREMFVTKNGYVFLTEGFEGGKVYLSRDDAATFQETTLPESNANNIKGVALDYEGYAYLGVSGDYLHVSQNPVVTPTPPTLLQNIGVSATACALRWIDTNVNDHTLVVERSLNGVDFVKAGQISGGDVCNSGGARGFFVDDNLQPNTNYTYRVKGLNAAGASAPSSPVSFTTLASSAQTIPDNRSWSAVNSGESGYGIVTPKTAGIKHLGGGKYEVSDLSLSLTGSPEKATFYVSSGQTFVGATRDLKPNGNSTWNGTNILKLKWRECDADETETITFTLNANDPIPTAPGLVYAYVSTDADIEVSWQAKYYEKTYAVERSLNASTGFSVIATLNYPNTRHADNSSLVDGTTYFYRVRAFNGNGTPQASPYSTVTSVRFQKPNFKVASNAMTNFKASPTLGSFWADFNNDGHDDYYTSRFNPTTESVQPVIFKNLGNSDFEIINPALDNQLYFWSSIVDFDNDNIPDLALAAQESNVFDLYRGNGDFTFTNIPAGDLGDLGNTIDKPVTSPTWADVNNDGLLDLLLLTSENGGIKLYKQNSNHSFTKIEGGDISEDIDNAFHAEWSDYDNDGFQDFLVTNIAGPARLYKNNGDETFTKITSSGIDAAELYCAAWGDYNNDGNLDLFSAERTKNALYKNNGNGTFTKDISSSISEENSSLAASWGDYNNDGFLDLITTGFGTTQTRLFIRDATAPSSIVFTKIIGEQINSLSTSHYSVAHTDYDKNGLLDLSLSAFIFDDSNDDGLIATNNNLYRNNNAVANWSEVNLSPVNGNKDGIGAKIILTAGGKTQARELTSASSLFSKSSMTAHFGLGASTSITNIHVKWTDGTSQDFPNPPANQILNIVQDVSGPAIAFTPPASVPKASTISLSIPVTDQSSITSVVVFATEISKDHFQPVNATPATGNNWNASLVAATNFDDIGAEYYIEATDVYGNKTRHPQGTGNHLTYLIYSGEQAVIPAERLSFGGQLDDWRIIAVPFELSGSSNTVDAVFDEFSSLREKFDYRIITYQNAEEWAELSGFSTIGRGKGYFINILDQKSINVGANLTTPDNSKTKLFQIDLVAGWNMIGNPYLTTISWADVAAANSLTGQAADLMKYTGSGYTKQTQRLDPYEGAFVFTDQAIAGVTIPLVLTIGGRKKTTESLGNDIDQEAWAVDLNLVQGEFSYEMGSVGMSPDATPGHDVYDYVTPPRFFNYLEMNFDHPEYFAKRFSRDIVPTAQNFTWDFTVDSNLEGMAELNWNNAPLMGSGKDLFLLDISAQKLVNMKETGKHRFDPKEASRFRVYYGNNLHVAPEKVQLGKAYPNPTNGYTTIAFSLPETGGLNQSVTLDIMDALGRRIGIVKQGRFNPGFHETAFDATELINGFYTYRLTVKNIRGQTTEVNKLIIK